MTRPAHSVYDREGRRKYLTRSEGKAFLKAAEQLSRQRQLFCLVIYYTGLRISEALALTSQNIDHAGGVIRVKTLKKRQHVDYRRIPVPLWLLEALLELRTESDAPLWPFSRTTGWRTFKAVMTASKISGIHATTKGLRHAFGVRAALEKAPLTVIQYWMGHSDSATTAIYLAVMDEEARILMEPTWK